MEVAHKLERDLKAVAPHTPQTLAGVDRQTAQEMPEVLPTGWVEAQGNLTMVLLEQVTVATEVDSEEGCPGRGQAGVVDNTEVPEVVEVSW